MRPSFSALRQAARSRHGIVSLTTVLIISTVVIETAIVGLAVAYLVGEQGMGVRMSYNASMAARSGMQDAVLHILRNRRYNPVPNPYTMIVNTYQAEVRIDPTPLETGYTKFVVTSTGKALGKRVKLVGEIVVSDTTGGIVSQTYEEIAAN
jgi:hypothetical protein